MAYSITPANSTVYTDRSTTIFSSWLNDVNSTVYNTIPQIGKVVMLQNPAGTWVVYGPQGQVVNISASTTGGLQEAINYITSYPVEVIGFGTINVSSTITVPAAYKADLFVSQGITINYTSSIGSNACINCDSKENCQIRFHAVVVQYPGDTGTVFNMKPTNPAPTTGNTVFAASLIEWGTAAPSSGGGGLQIDPSVGSIVGNTISLDDSNGGTFSIRVGLPGSSTLVVEDNNITYKYIHGASSYGIQILASTTHQANIRRNNWHCGRISPNGASSIGLLTYGQNDTFFGLNATNEEGTLNYGVVFQTGATGNTVMCNSISGATTAAVSDISGGLNTISQSGVQYGLQQAGAGTGVYYPIGQISAQVLPAQTPNTMTETVLQTYTLPANSMNNLGRGVRVRAWGVFAANSNNKTVRLYFGALAAVSSGTLSSSNTAWVINMEVYRTTSGNQIYWGNIIAGNSDIGVQQGVATATDTGTIVINVTGQNGSNSAGDIICNGMTVDIIS